MLLPVLIQNQEQSQVGLGKLFGRLIGKLIRAAAAVIKSTPIGAILGNEIDNQLNNWLSNSFFQRPAGPISEFEPSPAEEIVIERWYQTFFEPFLKALKNQIEAAFKISNPTLQLAELNKALLKICVVKQYHKTKNITGLSAQAITWRNEYIDFIFVPFDNLIETSLAEFPRDVETYTVVSSSIAASNYSPLVLNVNYNCTAYRFKNTLTIGGTVPPIKPWLTETSLDTGQQTVVEIVDNSTVSNPLPNNPAINNPTTNNPTAPENTTEDKPKGIYALLGLGIAAYLIFGGKGKTKKSK